MQDAAEAKRDVRAVRELMRLGNIYAANKEWGSAMTMFKEALNTLYEPYFTASARWSEPTDFWCRDSLLLADEISHNYAMPCSSAVFEELRKCAEQNQYARLAGFRFTKGIADAEQVVGHLVFHSGADVRYDDFTVSFPVGSSASFILTPKGATPVPKPDAILMAYAWAHLAQATAAKMEGLYRQSQILDGAVIPALLQVDQLYAQALLLSPEHAWTLAHRGELHRILANCLLNENNQLQSSTDRLHRYVTSIVYFRRAIDAYRAPRSTSEPRSNEYAWACAHLGAAVINARAFVGIKHGYPLLDELLVDWPESWPDAGQPAADSVGPQPNDPLASMVAYLNRAIKVLVRALESQGFCYPWAQSYYSASLLLKGALDHSLAPSQATEVAALGQVVSSHAYYLDPQLLQGVFEPAQLAVNPPFELAVIHYSKALNRRGKDKETAAEDCARAWSYAWIGLKWPFKYHFQEGLQGLTICRLLAKIAKLYQTLKSQQGPHGQGLNATPANLIDAVMLSKLGRSPGASPSLIEVPPTPIETSEELAKFIDRAVSRFGIWQMQPFLNDDTKLNSNIITGLILTHSIIEDFANDVKELGFSSDGLKSLNQAIEKRLSKVLLPSLPDGQPSWMSAYGPTHTLGNPAAEFLFSLVTGDTVSIDESDKLKSAL